MFDELDEKKTKYFVIAIILLILIGVILVVHFNNKSLVSPNSENIDNKDNTTTTTTTTKIQKDDELNDNKNVNNTKSYVKQVNNANNNDTVSNDTIYKSIVDSENNIIFNYKLTDEIKDNDKIVVKLLNIENEYLISNNVVRLYDISLYDSYMNVRRVSNSLVSISIPLTDNLKDYDEYKIVYIDDNNNITDETFETEVKDGYIKFETTHFSKYGIIATKNKKDDNDISNDKQDNKQDENIVDLSKVSISLNLNNELIDNSGDKYVSTSDLLSVSVNGLASDYKLYYLLKNDNNSGEYLEFKENIFDGIKTPDKYTLFIKVVVNNNVKVFEIGTFNVYDIVFKYDESEVLSEDVVYGKITDGVDTNYDYSDRDINKNIVIKPVESDKTDEFTGENDINNNINENITENVLGTQENNENNISKNNDINGDIKNYDINNSTNNKIDNNKTNNNKIDNSNISKIDKDDINNFKIKATISLNGNIYLVDKTDISELEMTGHLIIDTDSDITFKEYNDKLLVSNIYTITIKSKEFSLNGVKYTYEYLDGNLVIRKVDDNNELSKEEFEGLFDGYGIKDSSEDLTLENNK